MPNPYDKKRIHLPETEKQKLRNAILRFFLNGGYPRALYRSEEYDKQDVQDMIVVLVQAGLLAAVGQRRERRYKTTEDGRQLLADPYPDISPGATN